MPAKGSPRNPAPLQGVLLLLLAALLGLAVATRHQEPPACGDLVDPPIDWIVGYLGSILTWVLWIVLPPLAIVWILGRRKRGLVGRWVALLPLATILSTLVSPIPGLAGSLGAGLRQWFLTSLGPGGGTIALIALTVISGWIAWRVLLPRSWRGAAIGVIGGSFGWLIARRPKRVPRLRPESPTSRRKDVRLKIDAAVPRIAGEVSEPAAKREEKPAQEPRIREKAMPASPKPKSKPVRPAAETKGERQLPDLDLLSDVEGTRAAIDRQEILETSGLLVQTLADFGVQGKVGEVHPGPVVTRYEFEPAAGIRVNQIVSRTDDIALALRAGSVRLVAPIPGKAAVGIEVPNRQQALISLKEIFASDEFRRQRGPLTLALGKEISGVPVFARLDTMPHLLVAGTTGSGKSVCLNTLLFSLLFRHHPEELRLLLIDPKRLELTPYDGIPALLCPVVTEARVATRMLEWLCLEMERRYKVLQAAGVKGLEAYRRRVISDPSLESLPYIVVVVDELADLITLQGHDIEGPICRLAHMARAVGIHMVLATQRPSVDVLTGVVKANFPTRIAFRVASRIDSRTILDAGGAECLLGRGDSLFLAPGKSEAIRVHGAYCPETDAEAVADFLREQPPANDLVPDEDEETAAASPARQDEMFGEALKLVVREGQASVSFLQRRLSVGYARAARLMDLLEAAGVVSPYDGSKAREVLVDETYLEERNDPVGSKNG